MTMHKKNIPLRRFFTAVAAATSLSACASLPGNTDKILERPLTTEESDLLRGVFGNHFKTNDILLRIHAKARNDIAASVSHGVTTTIDFWGPLNASLDYTRIPRLTALFMHEGTHLLQNRENSGIRCKSYTYEVTEATRFDDLCREQQAALVEDYTDFFLVSRFRGRVFAIDVANTGDLENIKPLIAKVIEDRFPEAKNLRLKTEETNLKAKSCSYKEIIFDKKNPQGHVQIRRAFDCRFYGAANP